MPVESMKFTPGEVHDQPAMVFISDDPQQALSEQTAGGHVELTGHRNHGDAAVQAVLQEQPPESLSRAHQSSPPDRRAKTRRSGMPASTLSRTCGRPQDAAAAGLRNKRALVPARRFGAARDPLTGGAARRGMRLAAVLSSPGTCPGKRGCPMAAWRVRSRARPGQLGQPPARRLAG